MKKIFIILSVFAVVTVSAFAQKNESEKVRVDIVTADTISSNIMSTVNTTNLGVRIGLNENKVGILAGGMIREGFCTADLENGFPLDYYINGNPYVGVELWNWEILAGAVFGENFNAAPYVAVNYNLDLIKPGKGFTDRLSLKFGVEYFWDMYTGEHGASKEGGAAGVGAAFIDLFSIYIPKASIGVQYTFGWGI